MTVVATPGLKLVTYMNHEIEAKQNLEEYSEEDAGKYEFIQGQTGEDGLYTLDLTQFSKQDLNCLCLPWDNTNKGTVWYILLTKGEEVEPIYIETDLTNQFKALTVNTNWTWNDGANTAGYTAENFCPKVTTNAGESVQVCEHYEGNCDYSDVFSQTITGLAAGTYKIELYGGAAYTFGRGFSSEAFAEGTWNAGDKIEPSEEVSTGVTLYAESEGETYGGEIPIYYATDFPDGAATVTLEGVVVGESGSIKIGMTKTSKSTNWHVIQLKGVTAQVLATDALESAVALAETIEEGSVPAAIYSDLTSTVDENNKTYKTADEYKTAIAAINDAVNKANAYAAASEYFTKMGDVLEATNVYTQEAYDAVYGSWLADYEAGTLDAEVLSTLTANLAYSTGWHSSNNIDDVLLSAWTVGGEQCKDYDKGLYINTWSTEGNNDGTDFFTPFFEYWTGDDNSLGANALQATVAGLEADGTYDVTVWARVRYKNGAEGEPYGIALSVGEGKAVDVCAGEAVEGTQFYIGEFTAKGKADAEGNLTITFNVAEDNNISWLSFKNVKYVVGEAEPEPEPEPIDPDLIEIAQDQGIGLDDFARAELVEGEDYNTYTAGGFQVAFKMYDVDVKDCDYVIVKFAEPLPAGWHIAFWAKEGQDQVDIPEGATEYKYVFADDEKCAVSEDGILPQICLLTL